MLPFTTEQFFATFAAYNTATWPAPLLAYLVAAGALGLALRGSRLAERLVPAVLAVLWLWTGIVYHGVFFAAINPAATGFALGFVAQGVLLLWTGTWHGALHFRERAPVRDRRTGLLLIGYAALLYPLLGWLAGHAWPAAPVFGVTPCPLTIFTFGVLLLAGGRVPPVLLLLPLLWSVVGGSAALLLRVPQDWMLPVSGTVTAILLLRRPPRDRAAARLAFSR